MITVEKAKKLRAIIERAVAALELDNEAALECVELFPAWENGKAYTVETRVYQHGGAYVGGGELGKVGASSYRQARGARGAGGRIMSARKGAARRRKFKKWALEVWSFAKGYLSFSKLLVYAVLYIDYKSTMTTLDLCRISVANNYTGSLPYLTALIAFLQAATATVLSFSLNKSKAENTTGGITYDTATKRDC
mgnify:CR=1 FL=1